MKLAVTKPTPKVQQRQQLYLAALLEGLSVRGAASKAGCGETAVRKWRSLYPSFRMDEERIRNKQGGGKAPVPFDASFFETYLGRSVPAHRPRLIELLTYLRVNEWGLVLMPPDHLKTSTVEGFLVHQLAMNPQLRCLVISKTANFAKKIVGAGQGEIRVSGTFRRPHL